MIDSIQLAIELQVMPSNLTVKAINLIEESAIVTGTLGSMIDKTIVTTYFWFRSQKVFKSIKIIDLNGIDITLVSTE